MSRTPSHCRRPSLGQLWSRRRFVRSAAAAGAALLAGRGSPRSSAEEPPVCAGVRDRVVQVRSDRVVTPRGVHGPLLGDLLEVLLQRLTGRGTAAEAWRCFVAPDDVVGLKFTRYGVESLNTSPALLAALAQSLADAGVDPQRIVAIDIAEDAAQKAGVAAAGWGWTDAEVDFGSGRDRLAKWLDLVTAIVNVPSLRTDNIGGLACCIKNLAYSVVKHPAQFLGHGCVPFAGDIVALPQVRAKLRLNIVDALRTVFDGSADATERNVWDAGILLGGVDPVTVDTLALQLVDRARTTLRLPQIGDERGTLPYLESAAERGLGKWRMYEIAVDRVRL